MIVWVACADVMIVDRVGPDKIVMSHGGHVVEDKIVVDVAIRERNRNKFQIPFPF